MKWTEKTIARAIALQVLNRKCLMLLDNCSWTGYECDVLGVTTDLRIIDVEVKISRADLKADAKKDKWWERKLLGHSEPREVRDGKGNLVRTERGFLYDSKPREHPLKVWKHYYALPRDIWRPELAECLPSESSGVLLLYERRGLGIAASVERRAKPARDAYRLTPAQVVDVARLANLRMWEAYRKLDG